MTAPVPRLRPGRRAGFVTLLLLAMGVATFGVPAIGILATFLIDDLGLTRGDIGTIVAVNTIIGALLSPAAGAFADRLGGTRALAALFALGAAGFFVAGAATSLAVLVVAGVIGGLSQSLGNPATNKAIAVHTAPGRRGVITGLKQSGVQVAIFLGGVMLPWLAEAYGWRATLLGTGLIAAIAVPAVLAVVPPDGPGRGSEATASGGAVPAVIGWLTAYGFLLGASGAATVFVPLFAEEALGTSPRVGGAAIAVIGVSAVVGRIAWARYADRTGRHRFALAVIAAGGVVGSALMLLAGPDDRMWLWLGVLTIGLSSSSWNSVGMLAVIDRSPSGVAGKASGRVLLGFLLGLGIAPRVYGELLDRTGSYDLMWWISATLAALTVLVTIMWRRALSDD